MIYVTVIFVIILSSIATNLSHPLATSPFDAAEEAEAGGETVEIAPQEPFDPAASISEYTTHDVEYEDEDDDDVQVTTKSGLIKCNISNSLTQLPGYHVQMSLVEEAQAASAAKEYIAKYKLVGEPVKHGPSDDESINQWHFGLPDNQCIKTPDGLIKFTFTYLQPSLSASTIEESVNNDIRHTNLTPGWAYFVEYKSLNEV